LTELEERDFQLRFRRYATFFRRIFIGSHSPLIAFSILSLPDAQGRKLHGSTGLRCIFTPDWRLWRAAPTRHKALPLFFASGVARLLVVVEKKAACRF
jgi:hypothetical protein